MGVRIKEIKRAYHLWRKLHPAKDMKRSITSFKRFMCHQKYEFLPTTEHYTAYELDVEMELLPCQLQRLNMLLSLVDSPHAYAVIRAYEIKIENEHEACKEP